MDLSAITGMGGMAGMAAVSAKFGAAGNEVANCQTPREGVSPTDGSFISSVVEAKTASASFKANVAVSRAEDSTIGQLLDVRA